MEAHEHVFVYSHVRDLSNLEVPLPFKHSVSSFDTIKEG